MIRTATAIETEKDGSITYYISEEAGYIPTMGEDKIPYVWPEDITKQKYKPNETTNWKISLCQLLENSIVDRLYMLIQVCRSIITGKHIGVPGGLSRKPFWTKILDERRTTNYYNSPREHNSLIKFLKNSDNLGKYIWIDGQPLYRLEKGKYMAIDHKLSNNQLEQQTAEGLDKENILDANKEDFEDYLAKEWSMKEKDSERRISD